MQNKRDLGNKDNFKISHNDEVKKLYNYSMLLNSLFDMSKGTKNLLRV